MTRAALLARVRALPPADRHEFVARVCRAAGWRLSVFSCPSAEQMLALLGLEAEELEGLVEEVSA